MPFAIARVGRPDRRRPRTVESMPDLARRPRPHAAGRRRASTPTRVADELRRTFSEVHPLPGRRPAAGRGRPADADRRAGRLPHDPGQHARGRHRRVGPGPPRSAGPTDPPAPLRIQVPAHVGRQLRGDRDPGRRAALEAGAHLRRPGHVDRARACATWRPTGRPVATLPDRAAARPVGALRPGRRSGRGPQPGRRPGAPPRSSPSCGVGSRSVRADAVPERNQPWPYVPAARAVGRRRRPARPRPPAPAGAPAPRHAPRRPGADDLRPDRPAGARGRHQPRRARRRQADRGVRLRADRAVLPVPRRRHGRRRGQPARRR